MYTVRLSLPQRCKASFCVGIIAVGKKEFVIKVPAYVSSQLQFNLPNGIHQYVENWILKFKFWTTSYFCNKFYVWRRQFERLTAQRPLQRLPHSRLWYSRFSAGFSQLICWYFAKRFHSFSSSASSGQSVRTMFFLYRKQWAIRAL